MNINLINTLRWINCSQAKRYGVWLFCCTMSLSYIYPQNPSPEIKGDDKVITSYLSYKKNDSGLFKQYGCNMSELNRMDAYLKLHKEEIESNHSHLLIVSYLRHSEINDPVKINLASVRASILRAYIKVKHRIEHEHVAFVIDTTKNTPDVVSLHYIPRSINSELSSIFYTIESDNKTVERTVKRYKSIPTVDDCEEELSGCTLLLDNDNIDTTALYRLLYKGEFSKILPRVYGVNSKELDRLDKYVELHKEKILSGKEHLSIVACTHPSDLVNPRNVNAASIQGSVVRSYIKVKHGIDFSHCSYAFDTVHHAHGLVFVRYEKQPVFKGFQNIYYTLKNDYKSIAWAAHKYGTLPLSEELDKLRKDFGRKIKPLKDSSACFLPNKDSLLFSQSISERKTLPFMEHMEYGVPPKVYRPFIGVKTNLLYLSGVTPELKYRGYMPNIEIEWYLQKHFSLNVDMAYTYLERNNTDREIWALSSVALESRYWLRGNGCFKGFYIGCYALTGDFDVKLNKLNADGYTGDFHEIGVVSGCHIPFTTHLGIEIGGRFGYRMTDGDTYYFDPPHYYKRSDFSQNKLKLTGLRILLVYRFNKEMKKGGRR